MAPHRSERGILRLGPLLLRLFVKHCIFSFSNLYGNDIEVKRYGETDFPPNLEKM